MVRRCFQLRYWARIRLREWNPEHETLERRLVTSGEFLDVMAWGTAQTARVILDEGLLVDRAFDRGGISSG